MRRESKETTTSRARFRLCAKNCVVLLVNLAVYPLMLKQCIEFDFLAKKLVECDSPCQSTLRCNLAMMAKVTATLSLSRDPGLVSYIATTRPVKSTTYRNARTGLVMVKGKGRQLHLQRKEQ